MDVSTIIAVFNDERHIERAIRSCMTQTLPKVDYEVVIVDDGSTDSTAEILESWETLPNIHVVTLKENKGVGYASNEGIKAARGQFVVRVDSDDYINENMLFLQRFYLLENKGIDAVACDYLIVDVEGNIIGRKSPIELPIACGVMFRKDRLIDIGLYKELRINEERELFSRFVERYGIYRIALPLYRYCRRSGSLTRLA